MRNNAFRGLLLLMLFTMGIPNMHAQLDTIIGTMQKWHKITLVLDGPLSAETANPNPFTDYNLQATFTNGSKTYVVPGYFAADGNTAESSATAGNKWHIHFAADTIGTWTFDVAMTTGTDVAIDGGGNPVTILDTVSGIFIISASDKTGRDHRATGRLEYVGENYLQYAENGRYFFKVGADAPENTLAYEDFDDVPNRGGRRKSWSPHAQDYDANEAENFTWQNGKGSELLGVVKYLSDEVGVNAFSFLTFSLSGDDDNVFPHLLKVNLSTYEGYDNAQQWNLGVHKERFDVSRLAQWEKIFSYADQKGMYLHFKTQETENDQRMDGGDLGRERKLYYRELIARFSHHLALNWNLGEENSQTTQQEKDMAQYFYDHDPYRHLVVIHTFPGQQGRYDDLDGDDSRLTGASVQTSSLDQVHSWVRDRVISSNQEGQPWVVACDEPGSANIGIHADPNDIFEVRSKVLYGTMMAKGAGVEYYYGYQTGCGDLDCQDHRSRGQKYLEGSYAIDFFQTYLEPRALELENLNVATVNNNDYVIGVPDSIYAVYQPVGMEDNISLATGLWTVRWFNPRTGILNAEVDTTNGLFAAPDNQDWIAIISNDPDFCPPVGTPCNDQNPMTGLDSIDVDCNCVGMPCPPSGTLCDDNNPTTTNDVEDGECNCEGTFEGVTDLLIEAENASVGAAWQMTYDSLACGLEFLLPPNNTAFSNAPSGQNDLVKFTFNLDQAGIYKIFARVRTTNDGDDSFWVRANNGNWQKWNKINFPYATGGYEWSQVGNWTNGDFATPVTFNLSAGTNTVDFSWREPGARFDKIFITQGDASLIHQVSESTGTSFGSLHYILNAACQNDTIYIQNDLLMDPVKLVDDVLLKYSVNVVKGSE